MPTVTVSATGVTHTFTAFDIPAAAICTGSWARSLLTQDDNEIYPIPLQECVVHNEPATQLPATAAADDMGILGATFGTDAIHLETIDQKANGGATAAYARTSFRLPPEYVDGQTLQLVVAAGMKTTVADNSATVDVEVHKVNATDGTVGADICATAAQACNNLTAAAKTFTITPTGLVAGDLLEIRFAITINDAATGTTVLGVINNAYLTADIRG